METAAFKLEFKYKGDRDYIHGTDIYSKIIAHLRSHSYQISDIDLSFHKLTGKNLIGEFSSATRKATSSSEPVAIFKFRGNTNEAHTIKLFETDEEPTENYEYDEDRITEPAVLDIENKSIHLEKEAPYSTVEKIVALNKALLKVLLAGPGKWYFGRLAIREEINQLSPQKIDLKLIKNIGSRITRSAVLLDDKEYGYIYFSKI